MVEALPKSEAARMIGRQLLRSGTSVGANYRAARRSRSRAEFVSKLGIVEEECDESIYWIEMLTATAVVSNKRVELLLKEAHELLAIIVTSIKTARKNKP
jgi:four helix bundle protein